MGFRTIIGCSLPVGISVLAESPRTLILDSPRALGLAVTALVDGKGPSPDSRATESSSQVGVKGGSGVSSL